MQRYFSLEDNCFCMASYLEDEFGEVILDTIASIDQDWMSQRIRQGSGTTSVSMDIRIQEMYHFLSILKLFDPHSNIRKDGFPQIVSQTPPEPWETE